jgi:nucleotide-binding universal stress UspA family protein
MRSRTSSVTADATAGGDALFERILVGIDSTDESLVAAAQAGVLRAPGGELVLLAAVERHLATHAGLFAAHAEDDLAAGASTELARAHELVAADDTVLARGSLVPLLSAECERRRASLIAVGVRPHRRVGALTFGGHDVEALHDVSCSTLIARPGWGPAPPKRIVVGVDGSAESRAAEEIARRLARRLGSEVLPVVGLGEDVDLEVLRREREDALVHPGRLVDAVVGNTTARSLVVVGRERGQGGGRGGGTAERLVYAAACSVLLLADEAADPAAGARG